MGFGGNFRNVGGSFGGNIGRSTADVLRRRRGEKERERVRRERREEALAAFERQARLQVLVKRAQGGDENAALLLGIKPKQLPEGAIRPGETGVTTQLSPEERQVQIDVLRQQQRQTALERFLPKGPERVTALGKRIIEQPFAQPAPTDVARQAQIEASTEASKAQAKATKALEDRRRQQIRLAENINKTTNPLKKQRLLQTFITGLNNQFRILQTGRDKGFIGEDEFDEQAEELQANLRIANAELAKLIGITQPKETERSEILKGIEALNKVMNRK